MEDMLKKLIFYDWRCIYITVQKRSGGQESSQDQFSFVIYEETKRKLCG